MKVALLSALLFGSGMLSTGIASLNTSCYEPVRQSEVVDISIVRFPVPNLEAAVRGAIGKPTGSIMAQDVKNGKKNHKNFDCIIAACYNVEIVSNIARNPSGYAEAIMVSQREPLVISIIVPVYNVVEYLPACIGSILEQPVMGYELILVDDGATDGSAPLCDSYAAQDGRIRVIHKENGGLSDARNAGMRIARGRYLLFVDGDDLIEQHSLAPIIDALQAADAPDVLFLRAEMLFPDGARQPYGPAWTQADFAGKTREAMLARLSTGGQAHVSACVKAVRRTVAEKVGGFWVGIVGEDVDFSIGLYMVAETYGLLETPYYIYRQSRPGSIMAQKGDKRLLDLLGIINKWMKLSEQTLAAQRQWIHRFLYHQYYTLLLVYQNTSEAVKTKAIRREIRRLSGLLTHTDGWKGTALCVALRLCGVRLTAKLLAQMEGGAG